MTCFCCSATDTKRAGAKRGGETEGRPVSVVEAGVDLRAGQGNDERGEADQNDTTEDHFRKGHGSPKVDVEGIGLGAEFRQGAGLLDLDGAATG
jgi:hypothetical protein